jgi:hypothetical protein
MSPSGFFFVVLVMGSDDLSFDPCVDIWRSDSKRLNVDNSSKQWQYPFLVMAK